MEKEVGTYKSVSLTAIFSPVTDLAAALSSHSLDTPRRRLSLETDTSSGTPIDTPGRLALDIGKVTPDSRLLDSSNEGDLPEVVILDEEGYCKSGGDITSCSGSTKEAVQVDQTMLDPFISCDGANGRVSSVPYLNLPSFRSSSSGSGADDRRTPGVLISPAPSPVFSLDEDSRDSGYGGEIAAAASAVSTAAEDGLFLQPSQRALASEIWANYKKFGGDIVDDIDDDGLFEAMQVDATMEMTPTDSSEPIAALLKQRILYESDKRPSADNDSADTYIGTPLKRKMQTGRLTRYPVARLHQDRQRCTTNENVDADRGDPNDDTVGHGQPEFKRRKSFADSPRFTSLRAPLKPVNRSHSVTEAVFALHKDDNCHLIGDHSMPHALPILDRPHVHDLKCISSDTLRQLINGEFSHIVGGYTLVDCRYPYEYEGGHVKGAVNVYTQEHLTSMLLSESATAMSAGSSGDSSKRQIYVFYCEFSRERGPKMTRFLRKRDRQLNEYQYPKLFYPEIYLLDGGYKQFYAACSDLCEPRSYRSMHDEQHLSELRKFRSKSKSWCTFTSDTNECANIAGRRPGLNRGLFSSKGY